MSRISNPPVAPEVMQASLAQLTKLLAEILRLHLTSRHLGSTGTEATMAHQLYNVIHLITLSSTSATFTSPVTATSTLLTSMQNTTPILPTLLPRMVLIQPLPGTASIQPPPGTELI